MNEEQLATRISKQVIETLTETLQMNLKQTILPQVQLSGELERHVFNRENLLWQIGTKGERGIKLYKFKDFFYPTDAQTIQEMVNTLFSGDIIKKNRNG